MIKYEIICNKLMDEKGNLKIWLRFILVQVFGLGDRLVCFELLVFDILLIFIIIIYKYISIIYY